MQENEFKWDGVKNERLKKARGISFEEILKCQLIEIRDHPSKAFQEMMIFERKGYIWLVPFVREGEVFFLKTAYPSRKYTKLYKGEKNR